MAFKAQPLNTSFLVGAIIGIILSVFYIPQYSATWALAFGLVFLLMLVASFISMRRAPVRLQFNKNRRPKKIK